MTPRIDEAAVEEAALDFFRELGYSCLHGPDIDPEQDAAERTTFEEVLLLSRLREALLRLNPEAPHEVIEEAIQQDFKLRSQVGYFIFALNSPPRHEPLFVSSERSHSGFQAIRDYQQFIECEQRRNLCLVGLKLPKC